MNIQEITFEDYCSDKKFDTILFFRSINHFKNTKKVFDKAINYLKKNGKIFIVENELF
jgi:2-polyprenyl-3-methyl-5-hydroxy-6-metoxy-1,4-benzoquinol methylase